MASFFYARNCGASVAEFFRDTTLFGDATTKNAAQSIGWAAFKTVGGWG
jgi:hypothetical protein